MAYIGTLYDYELKQTVFFVQESDMYVNETSISVTSSLTGDVGSTEDITVRVSGLVGRGRLEFYIDGELVEIRQTSGVTVFSYTVLDGEHELKFKFAGNNMCMRSQKTVKFVGTEPAQPIPTTISLASSLDEINVGESTVLTATVFDGGGNAMEGATVSFNGGGISASAITDVNGVATYTYTGVFVGTITVTASVEDISNSVTFIVHDIEVVPASISLVASSSSIDIGETTTLTATVLDSDNNPLEMVAVLFSGNGISSTVTTDSNGMATYEFTGVSVGSTVISASAGELSDTVTILVNGAVIVPATISLTVDNDTIMSGETATLTATVLDGDGLPCEGVEVSFSSDITNTTPYSNITNNQGMVTYSYDSGSVGDFTVTASANGLSDSVLIQDCFFQDPMTSESGKWSIPSGVSLSYSTVGATLTATSYKSLLSVGSWTAQPVTLEFTVNQVTNNKEAQPIVMIANGSGLPLMGVNVKNSVWTIMRNNTSTSSTTNYITTTSISLQQGDIVRLKQTSTNYIVEVERSGEVITISDTEWTYGASTFNVRFDTGTNRSLTFRDVKLKPLME